MSEQVIAQVLRENGLSDKPSEFDSDIHSWRCQYPERYGPCACFQELVADLTARVQAAPAEDAARLAEARAEERADILAKLERLAGNLDYSGDVNRVLRALRNVLPPLGVTAPTASEAGS